MVNENTQSWVQTPTDGAGKRLDTRLFTTSAGTAVHREIMAIGGTTIGEITRVISGALSVKSSDNLALYNQLPRAIGQQSAASSVSVVVAPRPVQVRSDTAASFNVTVGGGSVGLNAIGGLGINPPIYSQFQRTVGQNTAASSVPVVLAPRPVIVRSPTLGSFLSAVNPWDGAAFYNLPERQIDNNVINASSSGVLVMGAVDDVAVAQLGEGNFGYARITPGRLLLIQPYAPPSLTLGTSILVSGTVPALLFSAPGASLRNYITSLMASNESAATNTIVEVFERSTTGRRLARASIAFAGGGFAQAYPIPLRGNTNATVVVRVVTAAGISVSAQGFTGA